MRFSGQIFSLLFILILAGCVSKGDFEVMQRDMDELKNRHVALEKDFNVLKTETKEGTDKTLAESQKEIQSLRKEIADLQATLEGAKVDMQVLAGKVDDAAQSAKKPAEDITMLKEDMDRRLTSLETRLANLEKGSETKQTPLTPEAPRRCPSTGSGAPKR